MSLRRIASRLVVAAVVALTTPTHRVAAQAPRATLLPRTDVDELLDAGRWTEAEELLYAGVRDQPRDPIARTNLARYLAARGALRPALTLIHEAEEFGLPADDALELAAPIRALLELRRQQAAGARDSTVAVRAPSEHGVLLRLPVVRTSGRDTLWLDLVPRMIGTDSVTGESPRIGIEVLEGLVPEYDVARRTLQLHADSRSALRALGKRYQVLRDDRDIRVLVGRGSVLSLPDALEQLGAQWWQLDLLHGLLVVR